MPRFLLRLFAVAAVVWLAWFVFNRQNGTVEANSTLYLRLTVPMPEVESDGFLPFGSDRPTLRATVAEIRQAQNDAHLSAVVIEPRVSAGMWGQLQELRAAIDRHFGAGTPGVRHFRDTLQARLLNYFTQVQAVVRTACETQRQINQLLGRDEPAQRFSAADIDIYVHLDGHTEGRVPFLLDELSRLLDLSIEIDGESIKIKDKGAPA